MKKIVYIFFLSLFVQGVFAIDETCFQMSGEITGVEKETIKVITDDINNYYFQDGKLLNTKVLSLYEKEYFPYYNVKNNQEFTNGNFSFSQYEETKEVIIKFETTLYKNTFDYSIFTDNYNYHFEISKDSINWYEIERDLSEYDLDYVKIIFDNKKLTPTNIYDLSFFRNGNNEILVNSEGTGAIIAYNGYACVDEELSELIAKTQKTQYFPIKTSTKTFHLTLERNQKYDTNHIINYTNRDTDNDGVIDISDNCPQDYNPNQLDSTADGVGDMCSDKDYDGIQGNLDNCPTVSNANQADENKNGIGDVCETDSDKDSIFDALDNCVLLANKDQFDTDGDGVGDACDNCKENYNPNQKDIDTDSIGDVCDDKDDRYIESNKTFFTILILSIIAVFGVGIFAMVRKIKNMQK